MASTILTPVHLAATTALADLTAAPAVNKVRRYDIRACNVSGASAAGNIDLVLTDGVTTIYRLKNYPVPYNDAASAPDLEIGILVPAGWKFQAKASANSTIEVSAFGVEDDA